MRIFARGPSPREDHDVSDRRTVIEPLVEGERLDQTTVHIRYLAMPPGARAE
jgi:hypothetical protein